MEIASLILGIFTIWSGLMWSFNIVILTFVLTIVLAIISMVKNKKKVLPIISIILAFLGIGALLTQPYWYDKLISLDNYLYSKTGDSDCYEYVDLLDDEINSLKENVEFSNLRLTQNQYLAVEVTNKNDKPIEIEKISIVYYDEQKNVIDFGEFYTYNMFIKANGTNLAYTWVEENFTYDSYDINFVLSSYYQENEQIYNIDFKTYNTGKQITFEAENKDNIDYINMVVAYYKEGKIVGINTTYANLVSGDNIYEKVDCPTDEFGNLIPFDDFKYYITSIDDYDYSCN